MEAPAAEKQSKNFNKAKQFWYQNVHFVLQMKKLQMPEMLKSYRTIWRKQMLNTEIIQPLGTFSDVDRRTWAAMWDRFWLQWVGIFYALVW